MRIGIDARMFGFRQTGIGSYIKNLTIEIFKLDKINDYYVFLPESQLKEFPLSSAKVHIVKANSHWYSWSEQTRFLLDLIKCKLDLVHFPHFNMPWLYPGKFVVTVHDVTQNYYPGFGWQSFLKKSAYRFIFKRAISHARQVIVVSNFTKQDMLEHFSETVKQASQVGKINVIYEGVDPIFQQAASLKIITIVLNRYQITAPYLLYAGVWRQHKNILGLIKAFKLLKSKYNLEHKLVILGEEDKNYPVVNKTVEKLDLEKEVIRPGFLPFDDLPYIFAGASVYVLPSFREGFGLTPLEAMSQKTPVACSGATCLPEILSNGAVYFNPDSHEDMADKIYQLLTDSDLRSSLISRGQEIVKHYSWQESAKQTLKVYRRVLET